MMRIKKLKHRFVHSVPRDIEPGVLYVSIEYGTAAHSCCCGCGEQVVTPFSPTDWMMTYDGEAVSLTPSVGNWQFACRSHYFIKQGRVIKAKDWSQAQVDTEHKRDKAAKASFYLDKEASDGTQDVLPRVRETMVAEPTRPTHRAGSFWSAVAAWIFSGLSKK